MFFPLQQPLFARDQNTPPALGMQRLLLASVLPLGCVLSLAEEKTEKKGFLYELTKRLIYKPKVGIPEETIDTKLGKGKLFSFKTKDNIELEGYWLEQKNKRNSPSVLWLGGGGGSVHTSQFTIQNLYERCGANVFAFSYRGYGLSGGVPTEEGLKEDTTSAFERMLSMKGTNKKQLFVFGYCVGGGCAFSLLEKHRHNIAGFVIENTILSTPAVLARRYTWMPRLINWLPADKWDIVKTLLPFKGRGRSFPPTLLLASDEDRHVRPIHMKIIREVLEEVMGRHHKRKLVFVSLKGFGHFKAGKAPNYFPSIREFLEKNKK
ncbi:MAG: alpha/beta hydrolase family protein [Amphiamblys sp. WSBS2006]|nr:MAG: alpha/beta hydrolase family protein [Amphiamblys sp. WSBS2006]